MRCDKTQPNENLKGLALVAAGEGLVTRGATGLDQFSSNRCPSAARRKLRTPNSTLRTFFWCLPFLLAGVCFWQALPGSRSSSPSTATASVLPAANVIASPASQRTLVTRPIQEVQVGQRVLAENPELRGQDVPHTVFDPADTRLVVLHMAKPDGHELTIDTLVPLESLLAAAIERVDSDVDDLIQPRPIVGSEEIVFLNESLLGHVIELNLPELGIEGPAAIKSIHPCPGIEPDDGTGRRVVTSVFRHSAANVVDVQTRGSEESIGVTANHPFWSEDRQSFVPAGELREGECLRAASGTLIQVARIVPRAGPPVSVFNFEVDGQHVYSVGASGLLVHNARNLGRLGKQARLRELANDVNLGSADIGWIRQEMNSIARGQRSTIRVPPGKNLAHRRGYEAKKGFSYSLAICRTRSCTICSTCMKDFDMAWVLKDAELQSVLRLEGPKRYEYCVKKVADEGRIWTLRSPKGFALLGDDEQHELVPIWPHERYAAVCANGNWADFHPDAIDLEAWLDRWIPGMERKNNLVAVFPTPQRVGVSVEPRKFDADLREELIQYE